MSGNEINNPNKDIKQKRNKAIPSLSLIISLTALAGSAFTYLSFKNTNLIQDQGIGQEIKINSSKIEDLQKGLEVMESSRSQVIASLNDQNQAQSQSIAALQKQIEYLNAQVTSPTRDVYTDLSIINIQSAIDYLTLAKDVALFSNDIVKANSLVNVAFQKLQSVPTVEISASEQMSVRNALKNHTTSTDVIRSFVTIEGQVAGLTLVTPENATQPKPQNSNGEKNKLLGYLGSMVEIQDISKDQKLIATKESQQYVSDTLYMTLINLQNALYINDETFIKQAKDNLLNILKTYFVQDDKAKQVISEIDKLHAQQAGNLNDEIDKLIDKLTKQQNQLISEAKQSSNIVKEN